MDLKAAVKLPPDEDENEWLAVHGALWRKGDSQVGLAGRRSNLSPLPPLLPLAAVDFFNRINLIYGTVCDFCDSESCPHMSGGTKFVWGQDRRGDGHKVAAC